MKKNTLAYLLNIGGISKILRLQKKNTLTVLSLHRISYQQDYFWDPIRPDSFEQLLQYLIRHYNIISFNDIPGIRSKSKISKPYLVLSFDDGYYDFYEHALPILIKYQLPSNHNVVNGCANNNEIIWTQRLNSIFNHCRTNNLTDLVFNDNDSLVSLANFKNNWMHFYLGIYKQLLNTPQKTRLQIITEKESQFSVVTNERMMNWEEIIECSRNKVEIGCHTYSHDSLSTIKDEAMLYHEIVESKIEIESRIGKKIDILALPNGQASPNMYPIIERAGINHVLYVGDKVNPLDKYANGNIIHDTYRVNLVQETMPEMILRTELFHSKIKRYA